VRVSPAAFEPDLARALNNLSAALSHLRRQAEALAATTEAAEIRRRLAGVNPAAFEPDLASALNNLGMMLSNVGRGEEALAATTEAAEIYRRLVGVNPAAFEPHLATALNNLSTNLSDSGWREEALAATTEAVEIHRRLAGVSPAPFEPDLVRGLLNFAWVRIVGQMELPQALTAIEESAILYHRLVQRPPQAFTNDFYDALATLADVLDSLDHSQEAASIRHMLLRR
jgi:tetratricopeptide (TPR) repeat protein